MRLHEILDLPAPFEVEADTDEAYHATAQLDPTNELNLFATDATGDGAWEVEFNVYDQKTRSSSFYKTGQNKGERDRHGFEFKTFATVRAILDDFVRRRDPKRFAFDADKFEGRGDLYASMIRRAAPQGYRVTRDDETSAVHTKFTLVREA